MVYVKSTNCIDGFKKTLGMSRFCGIMPLDEQCHLGPLLILFSTLLYSFQLSLISLWYWLHYVHELKFSISTSLTFFRICSNTLSLVLISYRFAQKRHELTAVMWSLTVIDKALFSANLPWEWSVYHVANGGNLIMIIVSLIINIICTIHESVLWIVIFYTDFLLILLSMNQFCTFLRFIGYCLKRISCSKDAKSFPKLYAVIENFWQVLNDIYGPGITCIIMTLYLGILNLLYNLFLARNIAPILHINSIALAIIYCMILLQIILTCQKLAAEVNKFNLDLYNGQKFSRKLLDCEELQFHFETMEEFEFSAYNFFPVNISLIGSMILSGATYLVTLLQFTPTGIQKTE